MGPCFANPFFVPKNFGEKNRALDGLVISTGLLPLPGAAPGHQRQLLSGTWFFLPVVQMSIQKGPVKIQQVEASWSFWENWIHRFWEKKLLSLLMCPLTLWIKSPRKRIELLSPRCTKTASTVHIVLWAARDCRGPRRGVPSRRHWSQKQLDNC